MNRKMIFSTIGKLVIAEAGMLSLPLCFSLLYREECYKSFLATIVICLAVGFLSLVFFKPNNSIIYAKEGFIIVAFSWIVLSLAGALPFYFSGEIKSYIDAFFETVSGFTTTGASILSDVEKMSHGLLFWRSFTHWIGGMGVLVFIMAITSNFADRSIHIMRAEVPGPTVGKIVPKIKDTAKILYKIYIAITALEIIFLLFGGMSPFEAVVHSFGTAGTGGFGIKSDSIGGYSPYIQWVITVFMALFGVNFNLYYLLLIKKFKGVFKSGELWCYIGICTISAMLIASNIYPIYKSVSESIRLSAFQVSSILTTTGYATCDFNQWPEFSKAILFTLMFIGGCAGSTAGGLKVSRVIIMTKQIKKELKKLIHPRSVSVIRSEGQKVDDDTLRSVGSYIFVYIFCIAVIFLVISIDKFDFATNFSAVIACFNNVGPGFGMVGPASNFAEFSVLSKIVLSVAMLLGRLEIFPLLILVSPVTWSKN